MSYTGHGSEEQAEGLPHEADHDEHYHHTECHEQSRRQAAARGSWFLVMRARRTGLARRGLAGCHTTTGFEPRCLGRVWIWRTHAF